MNYIDYVTEAFVELNLKLQEMRDSLNDYFHELAKFAYTEKSISPREYGVMLANKKYRTVNKGKPCSRPLYMRRHLPYQRRSFGRS